MEAQEQVRREVEVDTALAELYERLGKVNYGLDSNKLSMAHYLGIRPTYVTRNRREVRETAEELAATLRNKLDAGEMHPWEERNASDALAKREALLSERAEIVAERKPLNDEYAENPWSRFFLVTNHGGHIHATMACSTCRPTTQFAWLPELSGLTEKDAVEAHGPHLCSVCFPSAPVEWTVGKVEEKPKCPGSGKFAEGVDWNRVYRYADCPVCGQNVSVTSTGKLRAHKPKEAS